MKDVEPKALFDHHEWITRMEYYYSVFLEEDSAYKAAQRLPGVPIGDIHEAIETCRPREHFNKETENA